MKVLTQPLFDYYSYGYGPLSYVWGEEESVAYAHVPFDILLYGMSAHSYDWGSGEVLTVQNVVDGSPAGDPLYVPSRTSKSIMFPSPILVPGVTEANVDGGGRWGIAVPAGAGFGAFQASVSWLYEPVLATNRNRELMGFGGGRSTVQPATSYFVDAYTTGTISNWQQNGEAYGSHYLIDLVDRAYAPLTQPGGIGFKWHFTDIHNGGLGQSQWFNYPIAETPVEWIPDEIRNGPWGGSSPASIPWTIRGTFADFMLVTKEPVVGDFTFSFRKNRQSVFTISASTGGQRVFVPVGAPQVTVNPGDHVCWHCTTATGPLAGQLLWSFRRNDADIRSGFGETGFAEGFGAV